jgi:PAS domain S-box-containing protein
MRKRSEKVKSEVLRDRLIGLGERSFRKSYYPELQSRLDELERFRSLLDHTHDLILLARLPSFQIIDANLMACRQLGRGSLLGVSIEEVLNLDELQWPEEGCLDGLVTTVMHRFDGTSFPVELTLCVDSFDASSYILAVARDISERLKSEEGLRQALASAQEERDKIDAIVSSVADGILVIDPGGRIILLNQAAENLLGVTAEKVIGLPAEEFLEERCGKRIPLIEGEVHDLEVNKSAGGTRILQARTSSIPQSDGRIRRVISLQDRTRDRQIDQMKTEFITTAAHELRTPLTSIQGFSEILLDRGLSPMEEKEFLYYIHDKALALGRLVNDLLDIARIEGGQGLSLNLHLWSAREILDQITPLMRSVQTHHFQITLKDPKTRLRVDRDKIGQVMENLLSNAIKYSAEETLIRVCGERNENLYTISVIDQGIGMTPEEVARIFDKFYRVDTSNRAVGGIGLGMSIAKSIVETHSGDIRVESHPGKGTTVSFTLPVEPEDENSEVAH